MVTGIDAKRIFFNNSGLGNYGRRFYLALANTLEHESFILYSPRRVLPTNPYLEEISRPNSKIATPQNLAGKAFGGAIWRSGLICNDIKNDHVKIFYGLSNEIPYRIERLGITTVVIIHDLIFLRYPELYPALDAAIYRRKSLYACRKANRIIAVSEQTKRDIVDFYKINPEKISVIYPSGHTSFYEESVPDPDEYFKVPGRYMISIGAITPRKNLFKTVEALALIKDKTELDLVVIGTAVGLGRKYLKLIREFIQRHQLTNRVHFLGNVPYQYVPGFCRNAELMIYPSQFEGFGMPIVEGLFSRVPVITSIGGCFPEAGGDAAIYISPEDPEEIAARIEMLMKSQELRQEIIHKGLIHAARFTRERITNDILKFHHSL